MAKQGGERTNAGTPAAPADAGTPPAGTTAIPPASGGNPPEPGAAEGAARQGEIAPGETTQPAGPEGDKADTGAPPAPPDPPPTKEGKRRVKCEALKGKKIIVGNGDAVQVDENGFLEVEEKEAERLLSIPGYEEF